MRIFLILLKVCGAVSMMLFIAMLAFVSLQGPELLITVALGIIALACLGLLRLLRTPEPNPLNDLT